MTTATTFTFNRNYEDLEQVEHLLPAFIRVCGDLAAEAKFRYNACFEGRIPGAEGPDEGAAIYLLQHLERERTQNNRVAGLLAAGWVRLESLVVPTRFTSVILYSGGRNFRGEWQEIPQGRVIPRNNRPEFVIPKGRRTHGARIGGRDVLVLP